jgi:hypothetical protein
LGKTVRGPLGISVKSNLRCTPRSSAS